MTYKGFQNWSEEKRKEVARIGGVWSHIKGTAHEFTSEEARKAGKKGGLKVSENREHMRVIGRKGGSILGQDVAWMSAIGRAGGLKTSKNREHMAELGRKGAMTRANRKKESGSQSVISVTKK